MYYLILLTRMIDGNTSRWYVIHNAVQTQNQIN